VLIITKLTMTYAAFTPRSAPTLCDPYDLRSISFDNHAHLIARPTDGSRPRRATQYSIMGNPISLIREEASCANDEEKVRMQNEEYLQLMEKMINAHLRIQQSRILAGLENYSKLKTHDLQEYKQVNILLSSKPSQDLKEAINDFFSSHIVKGLGKICPAAILTVLGNNSVGKYEASGMFIVWKDNKLLRYDTYCYRWNFAAKGVLKDVEGVVGVLLLKRVIDLTRTNPHLLIWVISHQASLLGKTSELKEMIEEAMDILEKVVDSQDIVKAAVNVSLLDVRHYPFIPHNHGLLPKWMQWLQSRQHQKSVPTESLISNLEVASTSTESDLEGASMSTESDPEVLFSNMEWASKFAKTLISDLEEASTSAEPLISDMQSTSTQMKRKNESGSPRDRRRRKSKRGGRGASLGGGRSKRWKKGKWASTESDMEALISDMEWASKFAEPLISDLGEASTSAESLSPDLEGASIQMKRKNESRDRRKSKSKRGGRKGASVGGGRSKRWKKGNEGRWR